MESIIGFDKERLINELKKFHKELVKVYSNIFKIKCMSDSSFKDFLNEEYKDNKISQGEEEDWNLKFCYKTAYTLLNKILFIRICEDMGFMLSDEDKYADGMPKDPNSGIKLTCSGEDRWADLITNNTFSELLKFAFKDMSRSYPDIALFKENKYEKLNFNKADLDEKFLSNNEKSKTVDEFEEIIKEIIQKLDSSRYDFKIAVKINVLGDVYEKFMDRNTRRAIGQFYTPDFVIDYILKNTVEEADVVENPFVRVFDPACGSGHFLIKAYDILRKKFNNNLEILRKKYGNETYEVKRSNKIYKITGKEYWQEKYIHYHLLKNCIYGADVDDFAVQLTTINLLMKNFENVSDELNIIKCNSLRKWEKDYDWQNLYEQLKGENIKQSVVIKDIFGNEKIENNKFDTKEQMFKGDLRDDFKLIPIGENDKDIKCIERDKALDYLKIYKLWSQDYDYIVMNPPYVRQEKIQYKDYLKNNYEIYNSASDLLTYFVERSLKKTKVNGKIGLIVSDKFTMANYGHKLRKFITDNYSIVKYKDRFDDNKIEFDDATVDTCIMIIKNEQPNEDSIYEYNNENIYNQNNLDDNGWHFGTNYCDKIKKHIEQKGIKIKNLEKNENIRINYGIKTGYNKAFIIDNKTRDKLIKMDKNNLELIKPILRGRDIDKYNINWSNLWIILIKFGFHNEIYKYISIKNYLYKFEAELKNRGQCRYSRNGNSDMEYKGQHHWLELDNNPTSEYLNLFKKEKIIFALMSLKNRFYYDSEGYYTNDKTFIITSNSINLKYLSGVLNSSTLYFYFRLALPKLGDGNEYRKVFVEETPVVFSKEYEQEIINNVDILLKRNEKLNKFNINDFYVFEKEYTETEINKKKAELKINQIVYCIYDLKPDEIISIEKNTCKYISREKIDYFNNIRNNNSIIQDIYKNEYVEKLKKIISPQLFIEEHIKNNKPLKQIAEEYGFEYVTVAKLRREYAEQFGSSEPWKFYNLSKLYNRIFEYLKDIIIEVMQSFKKYMSLEQIKDELANRCINFNELLNVMRNRDASMSSLQMTKEILNKYSTTWNSYWKERTVDKDTSDIIRYDADTYGLAFWSDEIHKEYFLNIIKKYIIDKPNKKKAEKVLRDIKKLDIKDKKLYVEVAQDKIDKAF